MIYGDTVQMQQVLLNLVMNAIEAMNATASTQRVLSLHTRAIGAERIEVVVADRGRGISFENEQRLFEAFFSTKDHGLGLGLSICSSIVNSHGGTLRITNNASGGARATVILPARQPATEDQCPSRNT
jgi:signal transduction histidine kinase